MKPKQLYIFLISLTGLILLAGIAGFVLAQKSLGTRIAKLQTIAGNIQLEKDQIERLKKLQADYEAVKPLAEKAQSVLPAQKQQAELVAQISTLVQQNGLGLSGLTFETTKGLPDERSQTLPGSIGGILVMPVRFETKGSYQQLQSLMRSFERQQRYMRVSLLEIGRGEGGVIKAGITLEVFLKP